MLPKHIANLCAVMVNRSHIDHLWLRWSLCCRGFICLYANWQIWNNGSIIKNRYTLVTICAYILQVAKRGQFGWQSVLCQILSVDLVAFNDSWMIFQWLPNWASKMQTFFAWHNFGLVTQSDNGFFRPWYSDFRCWVYENQLNFVWNNPVVSESRWVYILKQPKPRTACSCRCSQFRNNSVCQSSDHFCKYLYQLLSLRQDHLLRWISAFQIWAREEFIHVIHTLSQTDVC